MRSEVMKKYENLKKQQLIDILVSMAVSETPSIGTPSEVYSRLIKCIPLEDFFFNEHFFSITLNGAHQVVDVHAITKGLVNRTLVHPREVFRPVILDNATAIVIAHNHPSGNLEPSMEDKDITMRLRQAGDILGIKVLDHLIFSPNGYHSMLENEEF
ncbi:JAB domain-containing protein [Sphaerochaeta globosa]|uniref:DNA repair protein RadC n=1 Tax=Sphaerochaeta globosa (strain ATCC BAA-1886 / DSM 22777 / Buddy) TaxID=158189 RepID=F0RTH9_SPHGB|nr:JAB domain-containing protein [Sphaerochaeta globosa]ADY14174.1 DNA repair protein RadC [Sphaerochaeta globosa str. Buddy]